MVASPTAASPDPFLTSLLITHFVKVAKTQTLAAVTVLRIS